MMIELIQYLQLNSINKNHLKISGGLKPNLSKSVNPFDDDDDDLDNNINGKTFASETNPSKIDNSENVSNIGNMSTTLNNDIVSRNPVVVINIVAFLYYV